MALPPHHHKKETTMQYMTKSSGAGPTFTVAQVTYSDSGGFGALGESEIRSTAVFSPRGVQWAPCEGDNVLLMRQNGVNICLGTLTPSGLVPGEVRMTTSGGAVLHLKNNGEVWINDLIIPPPGQGGMLHWIP
jgi:hypothetical protein